MSRDDRETVEGIDPQLDDIVARRTQATEVISRYEPAIRRYCRSRTRTEEDADDAVQETFLRYLRRSEHDIRNDVAWLITAAGRACIDINRQRQRMEARAAPGPWNECFTGGAELRTPMQGLADPEQLTVEHLTIHELLRRLPERERVVITHLYLLGASLKQVARYLGVSYGHAKVIAMRARHHAQAILARMNSE
jgi:RNA polymerase sigma factor (sigma-70 family)